MNTSIRYIPAPATNGQPRHRALQVTYRFVVGVLVGALVLAGTQLASDRTAFGPGAGGGYDRAVALGPGAGGGYQPAAAFGPGAGGGYDRAVALGPGAGGGYQPAAAFGPGAGGGYDRA